MKKTTHYEYKKMEELRKQMVDSAELLGLCHPTVLSYSKELDAEYTQSMRHKYPKKQVRTV